MALAGILALITEDTEIHFSVLSVSAVIKFPISCCTIPAGQLPLLHSRLATQLLKQQDMIDYPLDLFGGE